MDIISYLQVPRLWPFSACGEGGTISAAAADST